MRKLRLREGKYTAISGRGKIPEPRSQSLPQVQTKPRGHRSRRNGDGAARLAGGSTRSKFGEIRNPKTFQ